MEQNQKFEQDLKSVGGPSTPGADTSTYLKMTGDFYSKLGTTNKKRSLVLKVAIIIFSLVIFVPTGLFIGYVGLFTLATNQISATILLLLALLILLIPVKLIWSNIK